MDNIETPTQVAPVPRYLTPPEAGIIIGLKRQTVIEWILKYGLPSEILPSGRYRIPRDEFIAWLKKQKIRIPEGIE